MTWVSDTVLYSSRERKSLYLCVIDCALFLILSSEDSASNFQAYAVPSFLLAPSSLNFDYPMEGKFVDTEPDPASAIGPAAVFAEPVKEQTEIKNLPSSPVVIGAADAAKDDMGNYDTFNYRLTDN